MDILNNFAQENGIDVKLLKAIIAVEAGGSGFDLSTGALKIRFEVHLLINDYPNLNRWFKTEAPVYLNHYYKFPSYSTLWRKVHSGNQWDEFSALLVAAHSIGHDAWKYASFGSGQILAKFHYEKLGFNSAIAMYSYMAQSPEKDIEVWLNFIKSDWNLVSALQQRDITRFIRGYNGVSGNSVQVYLDRFNQEFAKLG